MNAGITEEVATTARTVVEALKSTPATLALVIFNVLFIGVVAYLSIASHGRAERDAERWQEVATSAMKACTGQRIDDSK